MQFYEQALKQYNQATVDPKKKNYFEITLTLVLLIVLLIMIYPAITHILNLNKEIQGGRVVEKALEEKLLALSEAERNLEEVKKDLPLLELALPVGSNVDQYLQKPIENLANKNGLTLKSVQFSDIPISKPASEQVTTREMVFTASLTGAFPNFLTFVKDLESFVRVTSISTLELKTSGPNIEITVQGTTNYLGAGATIPNRASTGGTQ